MSSVMFGPFQLDLDSCELSRSGVAVTLQPQPSRLLVLLVKRAGEVVTRDEIRRTVWPADTFVDFDQSVNFCVRQIRAALHDNANSPCYLETLPRRGYRFIAPVQHPSGDRSPSASALPAAAGRDLRWLWRVAAMALAAMIAVATGSSAYRHPVVAAAPTADVATRQEVELGRYFLNKMTNADTLIAIEHFEAAARTDPPYAPAFAALADAYTQLGGVFVSVKPPVNVRLLARRAAMRAIALDPNLAEAHAALGNAVLPELEWKEAEASLRRAMDLKPDLARAHLTYASYLVAQRRFADAIAEARRAVELEPTSVRTRHGFAWMLYFDRQYEAAIRELRAVLQMDRTFAWAQWRLGQVLLVAGRCDEALRALQTSVEMTQGSPATLGLLAMAHGCLGQRAEAHDILHQLEERSITQNVPPGALLLGYLAVGASSKAIDLLEHIYTDRDGYDVYVAADPLLDGLRGDPGFEAVCRKLMAGSSLAASTPPVQNVTSSVRR